LPCWFIDSLPEAFCLPGGDIVSHRTLPAGNSAQYGQRHPPRREHGQYPAPGAPTRFRPDEPRLKRAGLDYHEWATVQVHDTLDDALAAVPGTVYAFTRNGSRSFEKAAFTPGDGFLFGPETRGLPASVLDDFDATCRLRLPMVPGNRSLNLSNAVAVAVFEAWRQNGFGGAE
jgi:tRNA (cytidine/uridine-2'-O-)-methyltransferase